MNNLYLRGVAGRPWPATAAGRLWRGVGGLLSLFLLTLSAQAQQLPAPTFFADDAGARRAAASSPLAAALRNSRPLTLNVPGLRAALAAAPLESQAHGRALLLVLPLPDGTTGRFRVVEAPVMAPALAAQFPDIKTYAGVGVDDPAATLRLDLTPRGFHAQVLSAATGSFYIDPATHTTTQQYLSFWKRDMPNRPFGCEVKDGRGQRPTGKGAGQRLTSRTLRTYRLALAATAEYTAFQSRGLPAGSTPAQQVAAAQAAIVTSVNRVVGVYEKELDVRLLLVPGNAALVYTDATTDPYTNNDGAVMLAENQTTVDALIGNANYDIGHVFSTGGGGIAGLGVVCQATLKAQGVTGSPAPVGDAFDIDYVAHEMGHQFGGNHTFNGTTGSCGGGNRHPGTAYEPGSGSTIMAYAGICGTVNDLQPNSDAYFHAASYEEIEAYLGTTTCAVTSSTGNSAPVLTLPAGGKVLPIRTPFKLTGSAYDQEGDALSYCWEEYDLGTGGAPTAAQTAADNVPLFRSFSPSLSSTRYFPRLSNLAANTTAIGERLPTVTRNLNFRLTVRDQHNGAQGVVGGVNSSFTTLDLSTTSAAGPFVVTAPNTAVTWAGGRSQAVTWSVAGTTANGVNCALVNIRLSTDGGLTYPTVLLAGTANDGTENVPVPSVATTTARIMVEAADNYFFAISNANFTITAATACAAPTGLSVSGITAATASVSFAGNGAASYVVTTAPTTTTQTATTSPVSLTGLVAGTTYTVSITGDCGGGSTSTTATVSFVASPPPACNEVTDLAVSNVTGTAATLSFAASATATTYTVTTSPATTTYTVTTAPVSLTGLTPGTSYTVLVTSNCAGGGAVTDAVSFATRPANDDCSAAIGLTTGNTCVPTAGTVTAATQSLPASFCSGSASTSANDVWYSFVAGSPKYVVTAASAFDGVLEVFSGTCGSLNSLDCSDTGYINENESLILNGLTPGNTYYVRYFPYNGQAGDGAFSLCAVALTDLVISTPQAVGGSYNNVTVTSTGAATLSDNLTVYGTMTVQAGGSVTTDAVSYYLQGPGSFVLAAGATLFETNALGITNTGSGGFYFPATPPSFSPDATYIFAGAGNQVTGALLPRSVRNLTVNNGANLMLTNPVSVAQVLRLQRGNLVLNARRLLLRSSAAGTALVDNTGGVVTGATAAMQRALTGGVTAGPAYRHFSSPVQAVAFDSLRTGGFAPVVEPGYNTSSAPGTVQPFPTVFGYNQDRIATTTSTYGDFDKGWFSPASLSDQLQPTRGYTVNASATSTPVRFTGTFNTGNQNSGALARANATDESGWQLLGNPYPSPLDWSTVTAAQRPGMRGAVYVSQSTGQYAGAYRAYLNNIGGASPLIEAGSGYFVQVATAGTPGAVNLTNANRVTTFGPQTPFGRPAADVRPQLHLRMAGAGLADETYLYFEAGATAGVDAEYDAVKLPNSTGLNLASLATGTPLAIQGLAPLTGTAEVVIPLALAAPAAGSFTLEVADLANFANLTVYLRDTQAGTQQQLVAGAQVTFTLASGTAGSGRFALVFRPAGTLATQPALGATQVNIFPNPAHGSFTLQLPPVAGQRAVQATLLTVLGQPVLRRTIALNAAGATAAFDTQNLAKGIYVLHLLAGDQLLTQRLTVE